MMVYQDKFKFFVNDKREFYEKVKTLEDARLIAFDDKHGYKFVATNEQLIRKEFDLLFNRLKQREVNQDIFWFYCYYCCVMLQNYHHAYGQKEKENEYLNLRLQIINRCETGKYSEEAQEKDCFLVYLGKTIASGLSDLFLTPKHISKIKEKVAFGNIYRIYWIFCRLTITKAFLLARDWKWLDKLGSMLGKNIDVDNIISNLEYPNNFFKTLSVGFFAARFVINFGLLIKHVCFPSHYEQELSWEKRFFNEIYKRHTEFLNDIVWASVNLVTNYNEVFHIAAPMASWIVAGFLLFDVCLIVWRRYLAKKEFMTKRLQLCDDLEHYKNKLHEKFDIYGLTKADLEKWHNKKMIYAEHVLLLEEHIKVLDITWQAKSATFWFNAAAAFLLMTSFSAAMIFTGAPIILACYALCTVAIAMYLSDGAYNNYKEKSLFFTQAKKENKNEESALKAYIEARNNFIFTMSKNVIMPALMISTLVVSWQAALILAAIYLSYQLYVSYTNHAKYPVKESKLKTVKPLEEPPIVQEIEESYVSEMVPCF